MSAAQRKAVERLLVEASSNDPRKVVEGSVEMSPDGAIIWTERTKRGLVARSGLVWHRTLWDLVYATVNVSTTPGGAER